MEFAGREYQLTVCSDVIHDATTYDMSDVTGGRDNGWVLSAFCSDKAGGRSDVGFNKAELPLEMLDYFIVMAGSWRLSRTVGPSRMGFKGRKYRLASGNDALHDGLSLEMRDVTGDREHELILSAFWSAADGRGIIHIGKGSLPYQVVERFMEKARLLDWMIDEGWDEGVW